MSWRFTVAREDAVLVQAELNVAVARVDVRGRGDLAQRLEVLEGRPLPSSTDLAGLDVVENDANAVLHVVAGDRLLDALDGLDHEEVGVLALVGEDDIADDSHEGHGDGGLAELWFSMEDERVLVVVPVYGGAMNHLNHS